MAPLPPALLSLADATKMTANALSISHSLAFDRLLDSLCDGALLANGLFRSETGPPNRLTISPANWQMHKYNGASLHYDYIEIATFDLIKWLHLDELTEAATIAEAPSLPSSGAPGRPSSMTLIIEEAERRIAANQVDAPDKKSFAQELASWLSTQSGYPRATSKTIAQNREFTLLFNDLKKARNSSPK